MRKHRCMCNLNLHIGEGMNVKINLALFALFFVSLSAESGQNDWFLKAKHNQYHKRLCFDKYVECVNAVPSPSVSQTDTQALVRCKAQYDRC